MKKVLFAASECVPFVKTGGLADVVGALPKEFDQAEWDIRVVVPNYTCIPCLLYTSRALWNSVHGANGTCCIIGCFIFA